MPVQTPQWSEYLSCPVCQNEFEVKRKPPISLGSGHTVCRTCLDSLQRSPFDQTPISPDLPVNTALLQLIGTGQVPEEYRRLPPGLSPRDRQSYSAALRSVEDTALFLKPGQSAQLSRPMQRKLVTLVNCQLVETEGRARAVRSARSLGERSVTELILQHQNPQQLSANLWAAVRARGCQFLGPAMQEEVLKLVLLALEEGSALSRKVLVMYVVQKLETHYPQASKTSIGHVVQLLYRASCFKVTKRDGDSSLMQLKEEFRTYETLRREHDTQIVQIATEAGLRIAPDQWSSLLYADAGHKSHMQSIIDKLQTPQSFGQSVQELVIALQRTGDPGNLSSLRPHLDTLTSIDPASEAEATVQVSWAQVLSSLEAALAVVTGLVSFCALSGHRRTGESYPGGGAGHLARYKTSLCRDLAQHGSCPRGNNCTFAHSQTELDIHRRQGPRRQLGSSRGRDDSRSTQGTPSPTPALVPSPEPGNRTGRQPENRFETGNRTSAGTESVVTAAAPDLKPAAGQAVQAHAGQHAPSLPVAQVAPTPRVVPRETFHVTPLVDQNGAPMIDPATGQQLVAAPMMAHAHGQVFQPSVQIAGADGAVYAVQVAPAMVVAPPNQVQGVQQIIVQQPQAHGPVVQTVQTPSQPQIQRDMKHDLSPEIASKSLNALKDRKEEILTELGDIVGETNAELIGDIAKKQAVVEESRMVESQDGAGSRRNSLLLQQQQQQRQQQHQQQQQKTARPQRQPQQQPQRAAAAPKQQQHQQQQQYQQQHQYQPPPQQQQHYMDEAQAASSFSIWTSKPLVTINSLKDQRQEADEGVEELPDGICVSRFGPISRSKDAAMRRQGSEPRAVTANIGQATRSTSTMRHPLASASPLPDGLVIRQDHFSVLNYDPGWSHVGPGYTPPIQEGMDSVSMSHLAYPPLTPVSPLPHPRDQTQARLSSQNLTMYAESARIQKELTDLQRRISSLSVSEADQAMKRDRLAFELRYSSERDDVKAV